MKLELTQQQLQDIYEAAVSAECAEKQGVEMSSFDLLCALDDVGGVAHFIRSMIDTVRTQKVKPVAFIDGDISPEDMEKLLAAMEEERPTELVVPAPVKAALSCAWSYDDGDHFWQASCGATWQFTEGTPEENSCKFCQSCGGALTINRPLQEDE